MKDLRTVLAGGLAGAINGLLGTGGGMVLVPLLRRDKTLREEEVFASSVAIVLPLCLTSLTIDALRAPLPWCTALPYLLGAIPGGLLSGLLGRRIPTLWLHRILGIFILYGGIRCLCA